MESRDMMPCPHSADIEACEEPTCQGLYALMLRGLMAADGEADANAALTAELRILARGVAALNARLLALEARKS